MFENRKLLIATKHQKETVIAPILEKELGVVCFVDGDFDTDSLGTFTGEIERTLDPVSAARDKCLLAMKQNECDLGVASEGSFGPHPSLYFVSADDEFLIFIDTKHKIEIIVRELSKSTNFNAKQVQTYDELLLFAEQSSFPSHALILRKSENENADIIKGISDFDTLQSTFHFLYLKYNSVYVQTDMRAMHNPTRMSVIKVATQKLVEKIKSTCPNCVMPGFGVKDVKRGIECGLCGLPTNAILSYVYVCEHCKFQKEEIFPNKKTTADPLNCQYCNP
jgi:ribosomal protein S27AE